MKIHICQESALHFLVPHFINTTTFVASILGSGEARRGSIPRNGAVTEEQRSQNRKATQPFGRRFFLAQTSLLTPYRPRKGMRVARASSGPKIPRRKRGRIYETEYLALLLKRANEGDRSGLGILLFNVLEAAALIELNFANTLVAGL